jgi:hypothetical protein
MYIAYTSCGIERKPSVHFLPNLMSENHMTGKAEARTQTWVMLLAGSTQAYIAEVLKIILSTVKGWWKKRLSQKSLVDEKRSGRT